MRYVIERITKVEQCDFDLTNFLMESADHVSILFGAKLNWRNFNIVGYARENLLYVAKKKNQPVGVLLARLFPSIFDPQVKILYLDLLYVRPGGGRTAHILMRKFIDFGKVNANHLICAVAPCTNIKGRSLEKFGFKELETQYRLEIP